MSLTIALPPDTEQRLRAEAAQTALPVEEIAARRVQEADLLRRIFAYFPDAGTREVRRLIRKRDLETISKTERQQLQQLIEQREQKNAERLADLVVLAKLRSVPLRMLMTELKIQPARM